MGSPGRAEVAVELERALTPTASSGATVAVLGVGGIGKSTMLAGVAGRLGAAGLRVARSVATEPTVRQPFASLPFLPDVTREPDPLAAAVAAVDQWCATGAVVIWVDDAHHLDAASSAVLTRLAGATRDLPLAVLLSARPHPRRPELAALLELTTTQIRLGPLDEADVIAAVATRMGARPGPGLLALLDVAGGNPFTIGVLLDVLQQRGALVPSDGGVEVDPSHAAAPDSAAGAVRAFLAHLPADTTDLLSTLAVLGTPAEAADVAILARRPLAALAGTLSYAVDAGVLRWSGESRVEFTHDLFPEALLADVPTQLRAVLHRDAAAILRARDAPPGQVAEHAWRGGDPASAGLVRAVAAGMNAYAPAVAADLLAHVQPLIAAADTDEVVADRAEALVRAGRGREAEDLVRSYLPRATSPAQRARMHTTAMESMLYRANTAAVHVEIENLLATDVPDEVKLHLATLRAWILLLDGHLDAAEQVDAQLTTTHGDKLASGYYIIVSDTLAWLHGRPRDAVRIEADRRARLADPSEADTSTGPVWPPLYLLYAEGPEPARRANAAARTRSAAHAARYIQPFHDFVLGNIEWEAGRWDDATAALDAGLELARETGSLGVAAPHGIRALIDAHQGRLADADSRLDAVARAGYPSQFGADYAALARFYVAEARAVDAVIAAPDSDWTAAHHRAATAAEVLWRDAVARGGQLWIAGIAASVMRVAMPGLQQEVVAWLRSWRTGQMPGEDPVRAQVIGMHTRDHGAVRDAAQQFAAAARPLRAGFAWEEAGLLAARVGATADATRSLRAAIDCYDQLGATTDLSRIRARAHRLGVRAARPSVRRAPATGWDALTPTETTVASYVRQGLTNPQIATQLFLSPRTVQTHVSHILQKTQLRSRLEIATALH